MAIVVEDGTGLANAETYLTVADFKTYCDGRGISYTAYSDALIEQAMRRTVEYIDSQWRYKGVRLNSTQALEFPRSGLVDLQDYTITGIPARLKNAECELVVRALTEDLFADMDRGGLIKSESVGPISTTYVDGAPAGKVFTIADRLLAPYTIVTKRMGAPVNGQTVADPYFTFGMMDTPGTGPSTQGNDDASGT